MKESLKVQVAETKGKIKSFKYWRVSLFDAFMLSMFTALIATPGNAMLGDGELDLKSYAFNLVWAGIAGIARFWIRNPLSDTLEDY